LFNVFGLDVVVVVVVVVGIAHVGSVPFRQSIL
jgi:hypothetical protein